MDYSQRDPFTGKVSKPARPAKFVPEECSWPDCTSEGLHRWAPVSQPNQQGYEIKPLRYCDPHHEDAGRLTSDNTPTRKTVVVPK